LQGEDERCQTRSEAPESATDSPPRNPLTTTRKRTGTGPNYHHQSHRRRSVKSTSARTTAEKQKREVVRGTESKTTPKGGGGAEEEPLHATTWKAYIKNQSLDW